MRYHNQTTALAVDEGTANRKPVEVALIESRRYLQALFDNSLDSILVTNDEGRYIDANPAACAQLGYTCEELLQLSVLDLTAPAFREEGCFMWKQFLATGSHSGEYSVLRKDGTEIQVEFRAVANILPGVHVSSSRDVTERKREDQAKRESQEQYESLVHSIDGIVWEADPVTFTFTFVSKQAERILGYPLWRWFEGPDFWPDHMHPEDRDWAVAYCVSYTNRREDHQFEYRMIAADGHVVWLSDIVTVHVGDDQSVRLRGVMVDITERKLAEEALKESKSQLAEAQRLASVGSWNWNIATDTHTWSDELFRIYGLDPRKTEPSSQTFLDLVHPEDHAAIVKTIQHALETQEPINAHLRIIRPDGVERIIHSRGNAVCDTNGATIRMYGSVQDVTERSQGENALREAEGKYRDIFENAGEGIFQSTPDGRYIAANPALARMYGFASPEELIHRCQDISRQLYVDPARREEFKLQLEEYGAVRDFDLQVFREDGNKIWISVNARAVRDAQGTINYYEGTGQDITERKRAEETLRESEERYRELFENAKDALYVHDFSGRYLSVNRAAEKLAGRPREDIIGKRFTNFLAPEQFDAVNEHLCKKLIQEGETAYETEVIRSDGWRVAVEVNSHVILANGVPVAVQGTARDITERKLAEQRLGEYEKAVEGLEEMIVVLDRDYRYLLANRAFLKYRGLEREQLLGRSAAEVLNGGVFETIIKEKLDECFAGNIVKYESKYTYPEIGERDLFISYLPIEGPTGVDRVACVLKDITDSKQAEERLKANSEQLRALSARLQSAREEEGTRIAREIHDELGSALTTLRWGLEEIGGDLVEPLPKAGMEKVRESIETLTMLIDGTLSTVRRISSELRPGILHDAGLLAAIEWSAKQFEAHTGITGRFESLVETVDLSRDQSTAVFRILQEALTNVLRHAEATRVEITINEEAGKFVMIIRDDGKGITSKRQFGTDTLGIVGMRERAHLIGGEMTIMGTPGQGTVVTVLVPFASREAN